MDADTIKRMIETGLPGSQAFVRGEDGAHFDATVVSDAFQGKAMLQQHRMVYATLGDSMQSAIHALSLRTCTPGEWAKQSGG